MRLSISGFRVVIDSPEYNSMTSRDVVRAGFVYCPEQCLKKINCTRVKVNPYYINKLVQKEF
jgi:hypothetical protein